MNAPRSNVEIRARLTSQVEHSFLVANDCEFSAALQRAIAAACILFKRSYAEVAPIARRRATQVGTRGKMFSPYGWFRLLRDDTFLMVVQGGAT
jgi:hypothetical protein